MAVNPLANPVLLFDLDGTLVDSAPDLLAALNVVLAELGVPPAAESEARRMIGNGARAMIVRGLAAHGRVVGEGELDRLLARFLDYYAAHIADATTVFPGVSAALDNLKARGWRFGVCTNKFEALSVKLIEAVGLAPYFEIVAGSDTFVARKPDARHLTHALRRLGADEARAIMVGDSVFDVEAARNAGLPVIGVSFGYTQTPIADLHPDIVIDHFNELEAAVEQLMPAEALRG